MHIHNVHYVGGDFRNPVQEEVSRSLDAKGYTKSGQCVGHSV